MIEDNSTERLEPLQAVVDPVTSWLDGATESRLGAGSVKDVVPQ